ncbi:Major facilitator superfamily domain containing protein [Naviculisporaceae sp. PSN 640]
MARMEDPERDIKMQNRSPSQNPIQDPGHPEAPNEAILEQAGGVAHAPEKHRMTLRHFGALIALAFMWSGAQAPLFLFAAVPLYIYRDIGGADHWIWLASANLLATAAISPFVGSLSDIFGRRWVAISGSFFIIAGQIMCGLANTMDVFIGGMAVSGVGTGISELTTLAGVADIVPVSKRGYYTAVVVLSVLPFIPSVLVGQLIASTSSWRFIAILTGSWSLVALLLTVAFYSPPPPVLDGNNLSRFKLLGRLDWIGGVTSIVGLACLELGLLSGGYIAEWKSAQVLVPLCLGVFSIAIFFLWERLGAEKIAAKPILPRTLGRARRTMLLTLLITFISGANFFSVLMLWPSEAYNVYDHDPIGVGLRGLPFACGTLVGCFASLWLLSRFRGHIKRILLGSSILMTAGCGGLAAAKVDNFNVIWFVLFLAGLGVGGIVVPASTITTIICPEGLLGTITALTISIRIVGGAIGYAIYYHAFVSELVPQLMEYIPMACMFVGITDTRIIAEIIKLTAQSDIETIRDLPGMTDGTWMVIVYAGREAFARAYPHVYLTSIAFGLISIIASLLLGDISEFVTDEVAVRL